MIALKPFVQFIRKRMTAPRDQGRLDVCHVTTIPLSLVFIMGQASYFNERGIRLQAVSSPGSMLNEFSNREGAPVHGIRMARSINPIRDLISIAQLWRLLREERPHIVHGHTPKGALVAMISATLSRTPIRIYHMHGLPVLSSTGIRRVLLSMSERITCRLAHDVLAVSDSIRQAAIESRFVSSDRIHVLGKGTINGVDADGRFNPAHWSGAATLEIKRSLGIPDNAIVVGFVGRLVREKGIQELVQAWAALSSAYPSLHLLLVGPFEDHDQLDTSTMAQIQRSERIHRVDFTLDVERYYAVMDVFALPSYREGFPVSPMEAAAFGIPVVTTNVLGCVDAVIHGTTGTIVPPRNVTELASAIEAYVRNPGIREEHGGNGRMRIVHDFSQERIWSALYDEYLRLLRSRGILQQDVQRQ